MKFSFSLGRRWAHVLLAVAGLAIAGKNASAQASDGVEPLSRSIAEYNTQLDSMLSGAGTPVRVAQLLNARAALLTRLMASDPARAVRMALPRNTADSLRRIVPDAPIEELGQWTGTVEAVVEDDFEHHRSRKRWYLQTADRRLELFFTAARTEQSGVAAQVDGMRIVDTVAATDISITDVTAPCSTTGAQNVAVLMVTTPSHPSFPAGFTAAALQQVFFGAGSGSLSSDSLSRYWQEVSYGLTSATGQVYGPFALSQDYTCEQSGALSDAAIKAADSTVDFTKFQRVAIFFPAQSCSYGGFGTIGCSSETSPSRGNFTASTSWFPVFSGSQASGDLGLIAHELGHNLGLGHASTDDYGGIPLGPLNSPGTLQEYGDPYGVMGASSYNLSGQVAMGHYGSQHKQILNWLPASGIQEVQTSGTFTILPYESASGVRALHILRDAPSGASLWVEYRQPIGDVDGSLSLLQTSFASNVLNGALIHYEDPSQDPLHMYLLHFNPTSTPNNFMKSAMTPGQSWSDPHSLLTLKVNSANANGLTMAVTYDQPCAALSSPGAIAASGGTGTITVTAGSGCAWSASTPASWITLTGSTSGQGNGTVTFSVSANTSAQQRNAYITVQRQSIPVVQMGTGITVVSVTPNSGSGNSANLSIVLSDPAGAKDITGVTLQFGAGASCEMSFYTSAAYVYLFSDSGGTSQGPMYFNNSAGVLSNNQCSVTSSGSSFSFSGNQLQVTLHVNFFTAFAGSHAIRISAYGGAGSAGPISMGTWTVPVTQSPGTTIQAGAAGAPFTLDGTDVYTAPITFYWTPGSQHTIKWLDAPPGKTDARFVFQSWADGGSNPRTFTAGSSAATYTATIQAQYLLTVSTSPATGGTVTANPTSSDGFYAAGTSVTLTATASPGYCCSYFSGISSPTFTMNAPVTATANFTCSYSFSGFAPYQAGPGTTNGLLVWTGAGCSGGAGSNAGWLTVGAPGATGTMNTIPFSIQENPGNSRSGVITFTGVNGYSTQWTVTQDAAGGGRPSIVSLAPSSGSLSNQVFTLQVYDAAGWSSGSTVFFSFVDPASNARCTMLAYPQATSSSLYLLNDAGFSYTGPIGIPGSGSLSNSSCALSAAASSTSTAGKLLTLNLALTFTASFRGPKYATVSASTSSGASALGVTVGTFVVNTPAQINSPVPGTVLPANPVTFTWTGAAGTTAYWLDVGTTQGQGNIFANNVGTATSQAVSGIPVNGSTIYVRLWSQFAGSWSYADYTYPTQKLADILTPTPGAVLPGSTATFTWSAATGATAYWLDVGTAKGQGNVFAGNVGTALTQTVSGLPVTGAQVYLRLWTLLGTWQYNDYTYSAASPVKATLLTPAPGSVLAGSTVTFSWNAGTGGTAYWLDVGTAQGQGNIFAKNEGSALSQTVSAIPTAGGTIYVRLWTQLSGAWQYNEYTYTAAGTAAKATMATPTPGSTLPGATVTFTWNAGTGASAYWLDVGTVQGQGNIFGNNVALATSLTVTGIPTGGAAIYVRLWTLLAGSWQYNDYAYTAAVGLGKAAMISPAPGSVLSGSTVSFSWSAGSGATAYWLDVGTTQGQGNLFAKNEGSTQSQAVAGIPTTGGTIYVRLWTQLSGAWQYTDYTYTAAGTSVKATIATPSPGSTLAGATVAFTWNAASGASAYWLDVGTVQGQGNIFAGNLALATGLTVTGIPANGSAIYVRLWTQLSGTWQYNDYTYTAFH